MPTVKFLFLALLALTACQPAVETEDPASTTVTLLFTNDAESDPRLQRDIAADINLAEAEQSGNWDELRALAEST